MLSAARKIEKQTWLFWALLGLALALRLMAYSGISGTLYGDHLLPDEQLYHQWGMAIANGEPDAAAMFDQSPLPAYFLAGVYTVLSPDPFYFRVANIVFGLITCVMLYFLGKAIAGRSAGLISLGLAACYGPYLLYSVVPLKTSMALCLLSAFLATLAAAYSAEKFRSKVIVLLAAGVFLGFLGGVRSNSLIIAPVVFLVLWEISRPPHSVEKSAGGLLVFVLGLFLALSPVMYVNYQATGKVAVSSAQLGRNLYYGNGPENPSPYYHPMPFASSVPGESSVQFIIEASKRAGEEMDAGHASSFWVKETAHHIVDNPGAFLDHFLMKCKALISSFEAGDHYNLEFLATLIPFFSLPLPGFGVVFALGVAGIFLTWRNPISIMLVVALVLYSISLLAFYVSARYRLPLTVMLIPLSAAGLVRMGECLLKKQVYRFGVVLAVCLLAYIFTRLPFPFREDLSPYLNTHALILNGEKRYDEAIKYWEKSVESRGGYAATASLFLAGKYYEKGRRAEAMNLLDTIDDSSYAAFSKYGLLGEIYNYEGRKDEAIAAYQRSLELNSGQRRVRKLIIQLMIQTPGYNERVVSEIQDLKRIERYFEAGATASNGKGKE